MADVARTAGSNPNGDENIPPPPPPPSNAAAEAEHSRESSTRIRRFREKRAANPLLLNWRTAVPLAGATGLVGRQRYMEDAVTICPNLCSPPINHGYPVHYFAVYDGHGGTHFSEVCRRKMHKVVKEELMGEPAPVMIERESDLQRAWKILMTRVFARTEAAAIYTCCYCESEGFRCSCQPSPRTTMSHSGTTAVAVIVTETHYVVANCGDSRAILYRSGKIVPLSFDHKPDRADEKKRIASRGGVVLTGTADHIPRVQGMLAMSRAIGDVCLKPYVISEPDVSLTRRTIGDEVLIIASDGMWDVIPNEMAVRVAATCLREPQPEGFFGSRSSSAASLLARIAFARGSSDNISVLVVDLTRDAAAAAH